MKNYYDLLLTIPLFKGIAKEDMPKMFDCLGVLYKTYQKSETIFMAGSRVLALGIVLSGAVDIIKEDRDGGRVIIAKIEQSGLFAESFACAEIEESPVTVAAASDCEVLLMPFKNIVSICSATCMFHNKLIENMMHLLAQKNIALHEKMELLSKKTIREKLMAYLTVQAQRNGSGRFVIPFTRAELADYLCADRSALSRELCSMRDEGILRFVKNEFELL